MADYSRGRIVVNVVRITTTESAQLSEKNVTNVAGKTISPNNVDQKQEPGQISYKKSLDIKKEQEKST